MAPPPQYLQGAATSSSGAGPITATFANNVVSGSKIIVFTTTTSLTATPDAPTSGGFTWTAVGAASTGSPNGALCQQMFFLDTPASFVGTKPTISVLYNASAQVGLSIIEVSGLLAGNTTACLDGTQVTKLITGAASEAQPAYTSHISGEFYVIGYGDNGGPATWTVPAGYLADGSGLSGINGAGINNSSTCNNGIAYKISTGGAEGTPNWTFTGTPTSMGSGFIAVAFQIAWSSPTQSVIIPPGQQFAPLARQFGPVPPFALLQAEGQAPAAAPFVPGYGALRSPVAQGFSTDVGPNSSTAGTGARLPQRGRVTGISPGVYDQVGPPFKSDSSPVAQGSTSSASSSRNGAQLAARGRVTGISRGVYNQVGPPVYPLRSPVATGASTSPSSRNGAVFPPRGGRTQSRSGSLGGLGPAVTPQQRAVRAKVTPLPPFGRTATMVPLVTTVVPGSTPFYPLNHPVRSKPLLPPRGTCRTSLFIPFQLTGSPLTPLQRPVQARQPLPQRGRTYSRTGAYAQAGPPFYPLNHPVKGQLAPQPPYGRTATMVPLVTTGAATIPAPFYPLNHPVRARQPQPPRGRVAQNAGTAGQIGPPVTSQQRALRAKVVPLPPFGRTATMVPLVTTVAATVLAPFYPLNRPASAVIRPLPIRGRSQTRTGTFQQTGPIVAPLQQPAGTRVIGVRTGGTQAFTSAPQLTGSQFYPLNRPVQARRPLPPRGTAQWRYGTFTPILSVTVNYPFRHPVAAVIRPLPGRGRTAGRAGVFQGTGPAVKPLQHPVYAWRPGPRRGVSLTSVRPPAAAGTGSKFYPFRKPVTARQPLPPHGQHWTAPPYVPPFVPAGGHAYPYRAGLAIARYPATLTSVRWEADMRNPVRYSAVSDSARWSASLEAGRWFATSGSA